MCDVRNMSYRICLPPKACCKQWLIKYKIVVCTCMYMCTFVYLQTARDFPLRPIGDVTEAEIHQAADVEVMELHQCE